MHSLNIAHRNLRPENIRIDEHCNIKIDGLYGAYLVDPNDHELFLDKERRIEVLEIFRDKEKDIDMQKKLILTTDFSTKLRQYLLMIQISSASESKRVYIYFQMLDNKEVYIA